MLLNHSCGLRGTGSPNDSLFEDNDPYAHDTILQTLSDQTLKSDPGAFSVYCNSGFTLAEIQVERVSGMSFTTFIHQNFTDPHVSRTTKQGQSANRGWHNPGPVCFWSPTMHGHKRASLTGGALFKSGWRNGKTQV